MTGRKLILSLVYFLLLVGIQILFGRNLALFGLAYCFVYTGAFLLLPLETPKGLVLVIAFLTGVVIDMFTDTAGLHAMASVLTAYTRSFLIRSLAPAGGYENYMEISVASMGPRWYLSFMIPLLFLQCFLLFTIEYAGLSHPFRALFASALSTAFTLGIIALVQFGIYRPAVSN